MKNNTWQGKKKKKPCELVQSKVVPLGRKSYVPSPLSVLSFPWWHVRRGKRATSQSTADKKSHHTQPVTRAEIAPCLLSSPELNLLLTSGKGQGHFRPSLGSFSSWSLPSASLACLAHLFANVSRHSGSDWRNSAVCSSVGSCPRSLVSFIEIFFPCYLWCSFTTALLFFHI